jgi:hypothetical protein
MISKERARDLDGGYNLFEAKTPALLRDGAFLVRALTDALRASVPDFEEEAFHDAIEGAVDIEIARLAITGEDPDETARIERRERSRLVHLLGLKA